MGVAQWNGQDTPRKNVAVAVEDSLWFRSKILLEAGYWLHSEDQLVVLVLGVGVQSFTGLPFGKRLHSYGKSPSLIGKSICKSTISMGHVQWLC